MIQQSLLAGIFPATAHVRAVIGSTTIDIGQRVFRFACFREEPPGWGDYPVREQWADAQGGTGQAGSWLRAGWPLELCDGGRVLERVEPTGARS